MYDNSSSSTHNNTNSNNDNDNKRTDDERRNDELNEPQLAVAQVHGGTITHGRDLQPLLLLAVALLAKLLYDQVGPSLAHLPALVLWDMF